MRRIEAPAAAAEETRRAGGPFSLPLLAVIVASWIPVLLGASIRAAAGWISVVVVAVAIELITRRLRTTVLVCGFVLSSAFVASGLVTEPTHYMPVATTGGALALRVVLRAWTTRRLTPPMPQFVLVGVAAYVIWAVVTTSTSIEHRVSLEYLAGMALVCVLAFWAIPDLLREQSERERLLGSVGGLGVVVAVSIYVVEFAGNVTLFSRPVGSFLRTDLTVGGHAVGLLFARSSGGYLAPFEPALTMVIAATLLLGWGASRPGRPRLMVWAGVAFMAPAILLTLDRSAWLAAIVSTGVIAIIAPARRLRVLGPVLVCGLFAGVFLFVLVGALGANAAGACSPNCPPGENPGESTLRGGTGLSGREYLWQASIRAVEHRPVTGYGPGTDVQAIAPYIATSGAHIEVLTSHSTWLRTAVEMGVPGLVFLLAIIVAVAWAFSRRLFVGGRARDPAEIALAASLCGLLPAMTFESFLLGGVTFTSLFLAVALGLVAAGPAVRRPDFVEQDG